MSAAEHLLPDETDSFLAVLPFEKFRDSQERRESLALLRAVRLATDLETCEAILRGESVALSRLDPEWVKAYGG